MIHKSAGRRIGRAAAAQDRRMIATHELTKRYGGLRAVELDHLRQPARLAQRGGNGFTVVDDDAVAALECPRGPGTMRFQGVVG